MNGDGSAICHSDTGDYTKQANELINYVSISPDNYKRLLDWGRSGVPESKRSEEIKDKFADLEKIESDIFSN